MSERRYIMFWIWYGGGGRQSITDYCCKDAMDIIRAGTGVPYTKLVARVYGLYQTW